VFGWSRASHSSLVTRIFLLCTPCSPHPLLRKQTYTRATPRYSQILEIFSTGTGAPEKIGPTEESRKPLYRCVNALLTVQIQGLLDRSVSSLASDLSDDLKTPKFEVNLVLDEASSEFLFEPSEAEFEACLHAATNQVRPCVCAHVCVCVCVCVCVWM
jgi:hypothetical protein